MKTVKEILAEGYSHSMIKSDDIEGQFYQSKADTRRPAKFPPEKDIPNVLTLVRKAIRVFPDNQKIALYYSSALDKYLSVPYGPNNKAMGIHLSEAKKTDKYAPDVESSLKQDVERAKFKSRSDTLQDLAASGKMHPVEIMQKYKGATGALMKQALSDRSKTGAQRAGAAFGRGLRGAAIGAKRLALKTTPGKQLKVVKRNVGKSIRGAVGAVKSAVGLEEQMTPSQRFKSNLRYVREDRQQLDEIVPLVAAGLATAARVAAPHVARFAVRNAPRIASAVRSAAPRVASAAKNIGSKAKELTKRAIDKVRGKGKTKKPKPDKKTGLSKTDKALIASTGLSGGGGGSNLPDLAGDIKSEFKPSQQQVGFTKTAGAGISGGANVWQDPQYQAGGGGRQKYAIKTQEESTNFDKIKMIAETKKPDVIMFEDNSITINNRIAKKIVKLHESLNKDNKQKVENMLSEDVNSFRKIINFALRH